MVIELSTPSGTVEKKKMAKSKSKSTKLPIAVVAMCASTKSISTKSILRGSRLKGGVSMQELLDEWTTLVASKEPSMSPAEIYRGIGFHTLVKLQSYVSESNIHIASTAMGLVPLTQKIVPYDFTSNPNYFGNVHEKVTKEPFVYTTWWSMINERLYKQPTPIARLLKDPKLKLVVIAVPPNTFKWLVDDLLTVDPQLLESKLRVMVTGVGSSAALGKFSTQLLRVDKRLNKTMVGNRNDAGPRAAWFFIKLLTEHLSSIDDDTLTHQDMLDKAMDLIGPKPQISQHNLSGDVDLKKILDHNPHLLEMPAGQAYKEVKRSHRGIGSITRFRSIYTLMKSSTPEENTSEPPALEDGALKLALSAMEHIDPLLIKEGSKTITDEEEEEALFILRTFVQTLREHRPEGKFNARTVCLWAEEFCTASEIRIPTQLITSNRLSYVLKCYQEHLGIKLTEGANNLYVLDT